MKNKQQPKPKFMVMCGKGPELLRYDEYLKYIEAGEPEGCLSHEEWLVRNPVQQ